MMEDERTQKQKVLDALREYHDEGVCGVSFMGMYIPRYAARIYDLRQDGYVIEREWCNVHKTVARYYLKEENVHGEQLALST